MPVRTLQLSFSGGEVTPEFFGRIDDAKYQSGLALCKNFVIKPQGPVQNRAGTSFVREVRDSSKKVRLIPFTYSSQQTMVIELGAGYFRFHTQGATLLKDGVPYEIANPYGEADLFEITYVQSADVLTLCHPLHPPKELRRYGATDWRCIDIEFSPTIFPPTGITASASGHTNAKMNYAYVITSLSSEGLVESQASGEVSTRGNLFESGAIVTLTWQAAPQATRYNVYKMLGGLFGYIGETSGTSLVDDNIAPDLSKTPPRYDSVFKTAGEYPAAVSYFEQRRCFAGTLNKPQHIWMTKSGTESNMSYSLPIKDDDRISFRVAAREANTIRHIVPLSQLLFLTSAAEWRVSSVNSDAVTPTSIAVRPESYIGAAKPQPVIVNNTAIYAAARGGHVREIGYNWQSSGFITGDLSIRAPHLFDGFEILDIAYAKSPLPIVWFISSSGKLLGLTYIPEQQIGAWHQHDTEGVFESCAVVAEGMEDVLYVIVRRSINGRSVRYLERMASRAFGSPEEAFFVDSGLSYRGRATQEVSGLSHLEGESVSILADGAVSPRQVVRGGKISLPAPASTIHVGLAINAMIKTLPVSIKLEDGSFGQGHLKSMNKVWLRVYRSSGIFVGQEEGPLTEYRQRSREPMGSAPSLKTEEIELTLAPAWGRYGQLSIEQRDPLPLTIVSYTAELSLGGL